jgi:hypothetical protein
LALIGRTEMVQIRCAEIVHLSTIERLGSHTVRRKWYGCYQNPTTTMARILRRGKRHVAQVIGNPEPVSADPVKNAEIGRQFESGITTKTSICSGM